MQERVWTIKMNDGTTYEGLSQVDAVAALRRAVSEDDPFREQRTAAPSVSPPLARAA